MVELIVVVVILGILAAIAIPIFNGIENTSRANAVIAIAQEAATGAVADLAQNLPATVPSVADPGFTAEWRNGLTPTRIEEVCVLASRTDNGDTAEAGPGC